MFFIKDLAESTIKTPHLIKCHTNPFGKCVHDGEPSCLKVGFRQRRSRSWSRNQRRKVKIIVIENRTNPNTGDALGLLQLLTRTVFVRFSKLNMSLGEAWETKFNFYLLYAAIFKIRSNGRYCVSDLEI